jgi:hypothetical protein
LATVVGPSKPLPGTPRCRCIQGPLPTWLIFGLRGGSVLLALLGFGQLEPAPIRPDAPEASRESDPLQGTAQVLVVKLEELVDGQITRRLAVQSPHELLEHPFALAGILDKLVQGVEIDPAISAARQPSAVNCASAGAARTCAIAVGRSDSTRARAS